MNTPKRSTALLRHIRKLREMAPQMIEPLDTSLPKDVCVWLERVFKAWKKEPTLYDLKRLSIPGLSDKQFHIYHLKNTRYGSSKYNFIFQMKEEYDETIYQYYSTDSSSKRYQIAIIRK